MQDVAARVVRVMLDGRQFLEAHLIAGYTQLFSAISDTVRHEFRSALDASLLRARFQAVQLDQQRCRHFSLLRTVFMSRRAQ
jgi:hypothetical protein